MNKYSNGEKVICERVKKVQTSIVCDKCGKEIICRDEPERYGDWSAQRYYNVTTGHFDWGSDSCESIKRFDICTDCISTFVADYFEKNKKSNTAYIEIESECAYPHIKYEEVEKKGE